jgi:hypothetical protein
MPINPQEIVDLLNQTPLFSALPPDCLNRLASVMAPRTIQNGEWVFKAGDPADEMFLLFEGEIALVTSKKAPNEFAKLKRGDIFGEEALLFDDPRYYQSQARADTVLLSLGVDDFMALWGQLPEVGRKLEILIESREFSSEKDLSWLQGDEVVHVMTRRHPAVLWWKLVLPAVSVIAVLLAFYLIQFAWLPGRPYGWLTLGLGLPLALFWLAWRIIDWFNDFFIVTNKRVVWIEKVALVYESRQEAPLRTIMSVGIQRSRIGAVLNFADVVVTTYVGAIRLRDLANAETIASLIETYWHRAKAFNRREESRLMAEVLAEKLDLPGEGKRESPSGQALAGDAPHREEAREPSFFAWLFSDFIRLRYESGGAIVYRKHWFKLVEKTWLPGILLVLGFILLAARLGGRLAFVPMMQGVVAILFFMFVVFVWVIYQYADWRNDVFKVTLEQIIDLDRKPLGKVRRRSAPLENVLSIEYERQGFWGFLFNFGTVTIIVGNMELTFDHVYNPSEVQQDIFYRMGERLEHLRQFEINSERERVSEWIASYHRKAREGDGLEPTSSQD